MELPSEREWNFCMLMGLIRAMYQTELLTGAQSDQLLTEIQVRQQTVVPSVPQA